MADGYHGTAWDGKYGALVAGLASGALMALAYPAPGWWPLAWVAWSPLLLWIGGTRPRWPRAALAAALAGTLAFARVFGFLAYTAEQMAGLPPWAGWLVVVGHAGLMALHPACAAAGLAWCHGKVALRGGRAIVVAVVLVSVAEFALPWLFPLYLGNAFYDAPLWIQLADVVGIVGVTAAATAVSALLAEAVLDPQRRRRWLVAAAAVLGAWSAYGGLRMAQLDAAPAARTWAAVMVQHNPTVAEKRSHDPKLRSGMLDRLEHLTRKAAADGQLRSAAAVIWAEGALPFFWVVDPVPAVRPMSTRARPHILAAKKRVQDLQHALGVPLLAGTQRRTTAMWTDGGRNSAVLLQGGQAQWVYDKQILLAFGEYLPGSQWFPWLRGKVPGVSDFEAGDQSGLVWLGGARVLVHICYEALFSGFLRRQAQDAEVLVNLTNDVWFGPPPAGELHLMVQQARAVELRRPLLRSTVSGITAWIDDLGRIRSRTRTASEAVVRAEVELRRGHSAYRWWGDVPMWLLTAMVAAGWVWLRVDSKRRAWPNGGARQLGLGEAAEPVPRVGDGRDGA